MDPYSTHIPVTALALQKTGELFPELPILECGCGDYSTPMIWLMRGQREHVIYSADPQWSSRYRHIARIHRVMLDEPKRWAKVDIPDGWGLCLMDSHESVANRIQHIPALLDGCKVVVMHDAREDMVPEAKYGVVFRSYRPWTWIGSNEVDVEQWFH